MLHSFIYFINKIQQNFNPNGTRKLYRREKKTDSTITISKIIIKTLLHHTIITQLLQKRAIDFKKTPTEK